MRHDGSKEFTYWGSCLEVLSFLANHDTDLHYHLSTDGMAVEL